MPIAEPHTRGASPLPPRYVLQLTQFNQPPLMTASPWNAENLTTLTLPDGTWGIIRTAVLCFAVDERLAGRSADADHWMAAFNALKEAMGD